MTSNGRRSPGARRRRASEKLRRLSGADSISPLLKQSSFLLLILIGTVLTAVIPSIVVVDVPRLIAALVALLAATVWAALCSRIPALFPAGAVAAALDFVTLALIGAGTERAEPLLLTAMIVPLVWFATSYGRQYIAYSCAGVAIVQLGPVLGSGASEESPEELLPAVFAILAYLIGAYAINKVARHSRHRYNDIRAREQASSEDLSRGAEAQQALLPTGASPLPDYDVAGICLPAKAVGGDFYDWYPTREGFGFTLADVMGKGVGAGIIAATARAVVRSARNNGDPVEALRRTDDCFSAELGDITSFATVFHARVDGENGRVQYADAGHGLTLVIRHDQTWQRLESGGLPVGTGFSHEWETRELTLNHGDMIVSFSDGVLDLYDGTLTAIDEVARLAAGARSAADIVEAIETLSHRTAHSDDVTVLAVRRR